MRTEAKITATAIAGLLIPMGPGSAHAQDDRDFDGKGYPGNLCRPTFSGGAHAAYASGYLNTSGADQAVTCPIIQD
jgi:hypothetical protein